jgi:hypothetical protein
MEEHGEDVHVVSSLLVRQNTKHELDGKLFVPNGERSNSNDQTIIVHKTSNNKRRAYNTGSFVMTSTINNKQLETKNFQSNLPVYHDLTFRILSNDIELYN